MHALSARGILRIAWLFFGGVNRRHRNLDNPFRRDACLYRGGAGQLRSTLTVVSLLVAISGAGIGLSVAAASKRGLLPALGGGLLGLAIAAMHYVGVLAYQVDGLVTWHTSYLVASIVLSAALGALSMAAFQGQIGGNRSMHVATVLLVTATMTLHFTGMAAMQVIPLQPLDSTAAHGAAALALATTMAALLISARDSPT